ARATLPVHGVAACVGPEQRVGDPFAERDPLVRRGAAALRVVPPEYRRTAEGGPALPTDIAPRAGPGRQRIEGMQGAGRVADRGVDAPELVEQRRLERVGIRGREALGEFERTPEPCERLLARPALDVAFGGGAQMPDRPPVVARLLEVPHYLAGGWAGVRAVRLLEPLSQPPV